MTDVWVTDPKVREARRRMVLLFGRELERNMDLATAVDDGLDALCSAVAHVPKIVPLDQQAAGSTGPSQEKNNGR